MPFNPHGPALPLLGAGMVCQLVSLACQARNAQGVVQPPSHNTTCTPHCPYLGASLSADPPRLPGPHSPGCRPACGPAPARSDPAAPDAPVGSNSAGEQRARYPSARGKGDWTSCFGRGGLGREPTQRVPASVHTHPLLPTPPNHLHLYPLAPDMSPLHHPPSTRLPAPGQSPCQTRAHRSHPPPPAARCSHPA